MKNIYLLGIFLLGSVLSFGQACPPTNTPLQLTIPQPAFCNEDQVSFSTNVDAVNYFWHPGEGSTFATTTPSFSFTYANAGRYEVLLVVDYGNNCQDSVTAAVEIIASAVDFDFTVDSLTVAFDADTSQYIDTYFWDFGNQLTGSGASVITRYPNFGEYPVTLYTSGVCPPDSTTQFIILSPTTTNTETNCGDGIDNDGDGDIDCLDSDCACDMDNDGTIASEDPDDNNPCVPNSEVDACQNNTNPQIFEDFPFLLDLVDPNNCTREEISVYKSGSFFYILVETPLSTKLYFQTGQFYCETTPTYNCVEAYNLGDPVNIWTCGNPNIVDTDQDGTTSDIDPDDNDPCVPDETVGVCIQDKDGDGVFSDTDPNDNNPCVPDNSVANCDTTVIAIPEIFNDFPWLLDLVDPTNCSTEKITVYQSGAFNFIFVESDESGILYFETGSFYCQSAPNFDCVAAYNLSDPIATWTCESTNIVDKDNDGSPASTDPDDNDPCIPDETVGNCIQDKDGDGTFSDIDPDDNNPCVPDNTASNCDTITIQVPDFFTDFPWLNDLVDPTNCTDEKISIYQSGIFNFIFVESDAGGILYFETGSFYCQSAPNFDCVSVYGLGNPITVWSCSNPNILDADMDGVFSDVDPDDNNPCVPNERADNCISDKDNDGVLSDVDPDDNNPCIPDNTASACDTTAIPLPELFEAYPFLYDLFDPLSCTDEVVKVYDLGPYAFLFVENSEGGNLYYETGAFYCSSTPTYDCVAAYNLGEPTDMWACKADTVVVEPPVLPDCSKHSGTIVFLNCNGQQFFMIETNEGELLDIYFAEGVEFNYFEGQLVNYDFVDAAFDSPCALADKAVTITCIEEIRNNNGEGPALFEEYTFLYNLINPTTCSASEKVTVYTSGAFNYLFVESAMESALYFQDGSFFCLQASNYDCVAAYGFDESNITDSWTCGQATFAPPITDKQSLSTSPIIEQTFSLKAAPNPAQNHLWVTINSPKIQTLQLRLMDRTGRTLITNPQTVTKGQQRIPLSLENIGGGMYYLILQNTETGDSQVEKIVVLKK